MIQKKLNVPKIVMFGAGNVAVHLSDALVYAGYQIVQVYSRTLTSAAPLAARVYARPVNELSDVDLTADVFIFAINDTGLVDIVDQVPFSGQLALHTSGTVPLDVFKGKTENYGVIYPLQTFSKFRKVNFTEIPVIIEASSPRDLSNIRNLASTLSSRVIIADSAMRRQIHLAGVFASNFSNHMFLLAEQIVKQSGLSFDVLKPLIYETTNKALESGSPAISQTGPAVRGNTAILEKHLEMLAQYPDLKLIYKAISDSIAETHSK